MEEALVLKTMQCGFESRFGHYGALAEMDYCTWLLTRQVRKGLEGSNPSRSSNRCRLFGYAPMV